MARHEVELSDDLEKQLQSFAAGLRKPVEVAIVEAIKRGSAPPRHRALVNVSQRRR
jgi:predicted transcriptional regulator